MAELRGFTVGHQKVVLSCDLAGRLKGYAELVIVPLNAELRTVFLHCSQCRISNVSTADHPNLLYLHADPLACKAENTTYKPTDPKDFRQSYPELKRKLYSAINQAEEGELGISLPEGSVKQTVMPEDLPEQAAAFDPIAITIEYEVIDPKHGVTFVGGDDDSVIPHAYTTISATDGPRCWMPCLDTLWDRSSWELQLVVPRHLKFSAQEDIPLDAADEANDNLIEQSLPILAIASGELIEQIVHPRDSSLVVFRYAQSSPTSAQHIGWAVGPFQLHDLAPPPVDDAIISEDGNAKLHAFCLPSFEVELENTVSFVRQALDFYVAEYGSYPFGSYKLVFIDDSDATAGKALIHNTATMTTFPSELLHPPSVIEQGFESRHTLAYALASQWVGINIIQKTWADTWLINGLAFHLSGQFLKKLMGNNDHRFRLKKDVQKCCALDIDMPPLCEPKIDHPPEADVLPFINLKAPLVLHILDQRLLKSGTMHGLSRVLPKIFLTAISGELKDGLLSTHQFLRFCRKISSTDLRVFSDQWIYGSGCPTFNITAQFSRKKMAVEMQFNQVSPAYEWANSAAWQDAASSHPVSLFEGQMTVRVHEADGTPYEHVLDIRELSKRHDVPFNTKYKRIRRQTKRYQARAEAVKAAAAGDTEAQEELALIDMSFGTQVWEEVEEINAWRVQDWTAPDEEKMAHATYEWIRIDADFEWICTINYEQPDFMWVSQLQRDRDVVAQLEAVQALTRLQTPVVASTLCKTVLVSNYFYRIRVEAIYALASMATATLDWIGLFYLFKIYETRFCDAPPRPTKSAFGFSFSPKPNDFSDFTEYFIRLAIVGSLSIVRDAEGRTLPVVVQFLTNLLTYNDNSSNQYSDANYLCTVFKALAHVFVDVPPPDTSELFGPAESEETKNPLLLTALDEVSRYMSMDRLVPSYRNSITIAGLEWKFKMMLAGLVKPDLRLFFTYSREGNYAPVRMTAFDALLLLKGLRDPILVNYIFAVLREDKSPAVKARLAETMVASLPVLAAIEQLGGGAGTEQPLFIEEENAPKPVAESTFNAEQAALALRKEYGKGENMRENLLSSLLTPHTSVTVRLAILKLCETLYRPKDEPVPKLKFRMPVSAAPSAAPAAQGELPRIKLFASGNRPQATDSTVVSYDDFESSAVVQPSALAGVPQPQAFYANQPQRKQSKGKTDAKKAEKAKKGRPPKAHKAQAAGMSPQDVQACRNCHAKLVKDQVSSFFRVPVDPGRDGAPGYFDRIKRPMDLMTINAKLEGGQYSNCDQFKQDVEQIVENTLLYNGPDHNITKLAKAMEAKFKKQWARIESTLARKRDRDTATANAGKLTIKPTGQGEAALSVGSDQLSSQTASVPLPSMPPIQPFKIKLSGAHRAEGSSPTVPPPPASAPSATSSEPAPSAAIPLPAPSMPPPKTKFKLSFGGNRPKPAMATSRAASPAGSPPSNQKPLKKVKLAAPAPPPEAGPSANHGLNGNVDTRATTSSFSATKAGNDHASDAEPTPSSSRAPPPPALPSFTSDAQAGPSPAPALGQMSKPSQPPPVKISIKPPTLKIKPPKPAGAPTQAQPTPPAPAIERRPSQSSQGTGPPKKPSAPSLERKSSTQSSARPAASQSGAPAPVITTKIKRPAPAANSTKAEDDDAVGETVVSRDPLDDTNRTKNILLHIYNQPIAEWFRKPVDPVASGCPTYYDEIKHPMDLSTMWENYERGQYASWQELNDDFELIVSNCKKFNPPASLPCRHADELKSAWLQAWTNAKKGKAIGGTGGSSKGASTASAGSQLMGYEKEKKAMQTAVKGLISIDANRGGIFGVPVDPIALNIPHYFDVIPRHTARDLRTIKNNIEKDVYQNSGSYEAFHNDLQLMLDNARKFNPTGTYVNEMAVKFQKDVDRTMKNMKDKLQGGGNSMSSSGSKRSGSALAQSQSKKVKY